MTTPIRLEDRISTVLARDERLLEVLIAASPALGKLKNPLLRKTMSKLATVEHAARIAGLDAADLLARLNRAIGIETADANGAAAPPAVRAPAPAREAIPAALRALPPERIEECDVREELRAGREPFQQILAAARKVKEGDVLRLRAIFEPAPLYAVLARQGFSHHTEELAADDWCVWFVRDGGARREPAGGEPAAAPSEDLDMVMLDVRGLEPPEPMVRTLEALEQLPRGKTLVQINVRVPQFLIPKLAERGFVHEVVEQSPDLVRIFIRHATPRGET